MADIRSSRYQIAATDDPQTLLDILTKTLGQTGVVKKTRKLYRVGQTRIHIDHVEELELEVVLRPGQSDSDGKGIAVALLSAFGIENEHLIAEAYVDLLARQASLKESCKHKKIKEVAERVGFEPTVGVNLHTLSKRAPSTARPPLHWKEQPY